MLPAASASAAMPMAMAAVRRIASSFCISLALPSRSCGHSVAVHSTVMMTVAEGVALVPLVHVFRFDDRGLIRRLEAFLDFELIEMASGTKPDWMIPPPRG